MTSLVIGAPGSFVGEAYVGQAAPVAPSADTVSSSMGFSTDGFAYTYRNGLSHKTNARFARIKHEALNKSTMIVTVPGQTIRLDAVPRTEVSDFVSSASAPTLIQLENTYARAKKIIPMLEGATARTASYDRVLLAPVHGLCFQDTAPSSVGSYCYWKFNTAARTILADDHLEYDVYVAETPDGTGGEVGGVEVNLTDGTYGRSYATLSDAYGMLNRPALPMGKWITRKIPLAAIAGKMSLYWSLARERDLPGDFKSIYRNLRVTDGISTTRLQLWASGEPSSNIVAYSNSSTNQQCGPANSLLIRAFSSADGVQISSNGKLEFQGV